MPNKLELDFREDTMIPTIKAEFELEENLKENKSNDR